MGDFVLAEELADGAGHQKSRIAPACLETEHLNFILLAILEETLEFLLTLLENPDPLLA
ncbi:hypothetical protein ACK1LH_09300 [Metabacillus indicus]|uniref:hypothetical protein n=1 Tax=Metabacillus indicus TaxID=246786 RepID=UPI003983DE85